MSVKTWRAVAAAVLEDADAVRHTPLSNTERFTALQSGEIDMLYRRGHRQVVARSFALSRKIS